MASTKQGDPSSTREDDQSNHTPKKHRWLRRMTWCLIVLAITIYLLNGIVGRKVVHYFLNQSLEAQGMTGTLEVEGTLLNGLGVRDLNYRGNLGIQSLRVDHLSLDYHVMQLIDLKIDELIVKKIEATIDIAKFPPSEEKEETSDWKKTLRDLNPLIMHPDISLEDLNITILNDTETVLRCELGSIKHQSGTNKITLNNWVISDSQELKTPEHSATIIWTENKVNLDRLSLLPELTLNKLQLDWENALNGSTNIAYHDAIIDVSITDTTSLNLRTGEINTDDIFTTLATFGVNTDELDLEARVKTFDVKIQNKDFKSPLPSWSINGSIGIASARWEAYKLADTDLNFTQANEKYLLGIDGTAINAPVKLSLDGKWTSPKTEKWWGSTIAEVNFQTRLSDEMLALIAALNKIPEELKLNLTDIQGKLVTELDDLQVNSATANAKISGMSVNKSPIPTFTISANQLDNQLKFTLKTDKSDTFSVEGNYNTDSEEYNAALSAKADTKDSPWINALANAYASPVILSEKLDLAWKGSGKLSSGAHQGSLTTTDLTLRKENSPPITINLDSSYDWPKSVSITSISAKQKELSTSLSMLWDGENITISDSEINRGDERIGSVNGKLPYNVEIDNAKKFFAQTEPWDISIKTEKLLIPRMMEIIPMEQDLALTGTIQTNLNIQGSPRTPEINGNIDILGMNDVLDIGLGETSLNANLATENNLLIVDGNLLENDQQRIAIDLELPFTPQQWLEDDNLLETIQKNSNIKGTAQVNKLPLNRFTKLSPTLEKLEGILDIKAEFQGTIAEPKYKIDFNANLPLVSLKDAGLDDITDIVIEGTLDQTMILNAELGAKLNGGKFKTLAKVDLKDPEQPVFDLSLVTDHALVYRDDVLAMRANADIAVKGTLENAIITGKIDILESLFYKDFDLIPIGVPTSAADAVSLPSLDTKSKQTLPIPAPFDQWKLDLTVNTKDPILIRGNVGSGQVKGSIKVRGNLAKPSLDGTLFAQEVKAKLPFSLLGIRNGKIKFTPSNGFIPTLDIKGKSQVGTYNVTIYAYGSADDPKITLSSYPALPENEIMTLLATGTTNAGLEDRDVATFKTLQILLQELKQRNDRPGGNRLFSTVLSGIEDLDLKVGEANELTGEKYASATVKLHRRWYLTAQIDNNQPPQTRGLVIFALRFN